MTREEAINSFKKSNEQTILNIQAHRHIMDTSEIRELEWYIERDKMAIEALEQESDILDKIREEINEKENALECTKVSEVAMKTAYIEVLKIIDKYRKEG